MEHPPCLTRHFAIFFSFSLASGGLHVEHGGRVFGSIAFWGICWAINSGRHAVMVTWDLTSQGRSGAAGVVGGHLLLGAAQAG